MEIRTEFAILAMKRERTFRSLCGSVRLNGVAAAKGPNDVWTVDFKGWWFTSRSKVRCQPLTVRDEYSRFIPGLDSLQTTCTPQVKRSFQELFEIYGLPKAIRSDNGAHERMHRDI